MKKLFEELREGPRARRYLIMLGIQVVFFALLSLFCLFNGMSEGMRSVAQVLVMLVLFCFSLIHGFLSAEITDGVVIANLVFALFGGVYLAFIFTGIVDTSGCGWIGAYFRCVGYFLRYSLSSFVVSLIVKNTK